MKKLLTIILAAILIASLAACSSKVPAKEPQAAPNPAQGITVNTKDFTIIDPAGLSNKEKQTLDKLKTTKGFTYWQKDGDYTIAIFAGEKPSAGYAINVKSIEDNEGKTNILIDIVEPKDMAASVITYPYIVIKVSGITDNFNIKDTTGNTYSLQML